MREALGLARELQELVVRGGPAGVRRGAEAAAAGAEVARMVIRGEVSATSPPAVLRALFERLGPTYVKLGQFIASSPSIFPPEYVDEFQKCLDSTPRVPFARVRQVVEKDLGRRLESVFERFDPEPLASASVAQVHAAVLRGSGKEVAVKVLKPGVESQMKIDLNLLAWTARVLEFAEPSLSRASLAAIVGDVRASMLEEVDFTKEAANIAAFEVFLDAGGIREAVAPYVYRDFSSRRVLTMERLRGVPLTDLDAIRRATDADPEEVLLNALNTWFASVLGAESFHADVHAGNLLVLRDGRVGFIDFGIVGRISAPTWGAVQAFLASLQTRDYDTMARALIQMGAAGAEVPVEPFARDLESIFEQALGLQQEVQVSVQEGPDGQRRAQVGLGVDQAQLNRLSVELVAVGERNGVKFPREFGLLLKQILYFDRYIQLLAPDLDVINDERVQMSGGPSSSTAPFVDV